MLAATCTRQESKELVEQIDGNSIYHKRLIASWSVEELETLPAGTKTRTSHHRSPGEERHIKRKRQTTFLEKNEKRPSSIRRTLEPFQRQSWKTSERLGGAHNISGFSERIHTILKRNELYTFKQKALSETPPADLEKSKGAELTGARIAKLRASGWKASSSTKAGSSPQCGKGYFSQSQLFQCRLSYGVRTAPVCNRMHQQLCAR